MTPILLNWRELERVYAVANTPGYIVRHYRADETVQRLARSHSATELLEIADRTLSRSKSGRKVRDVTTAYAALVALTFKNPDLKVATAAASLPLQWASSIVGSWIRDAVPTETITLKVPQKIEPPVPTKNSVSTTTVELEPDARR